MILNTFMVRTKRLLADAAYMFSRLTRKSEGGDVLAQAEALARTQHIRDPISSQNLTTPLISFVVPTFNTQPRYLDDLLTSFRTQETSGFTCELILSDDGSTFSPTLAWLNQNCALPDVKIIRADANGGIARATNRGLGAARGLFVGLLDHDDALAPYAIDQMARALLSHPNCQFLYTDEVITDAKLRAQDYFLKPAWDRVLLSGVNYINHLSLYRRERLLGIGGLREGFEGSQDYDLVLRFTAGLDDGAILHLPYPAYLWRRDGASYSTIFLERATAHARAALSEHFSQTGGSVPVEGALSPDLHRVRFDKLVQDWPLVSVIIPSIDHYDLISKTLSGLFEATDYPHLEVIVVDNGTRDTRVLALYDSLARRHPGFRALTRREDFNFSRSVNRGINVAAGDMILFLNNDVEVTKPDWLKEMVSCMNYSQAGIVGARLLYPNGTLQHAGVIVGFGDLAGHWFVGAPEDFPGPMGRLRVRQSFTAVTGACMLVSRDCITAIGRFDETAFAIAYNDIDYCLRAREAGYRTVWTPFATLIHHESATRGSDTSPEKIERFRAEQEKLKQKHQTVGYSDMACSPWYSTDRSAPVIAQLAQLPLPR